MSTTKTKQPKLPLFDGYTVTKTTLKLQITAASSDDEECGPRVHEGVIVREIGPPSEAA